MHAAVDLAAEIAAVAMIVPTPLGASPRACARYRSRRPIIALAQDPAIADQLTLERGVYPLRMPQGPTVDDVVDSALRTVKELAGLPRPGRGW